jgi:hypothetical protein
MSALQLVWLQGFFLPVATRRSHIVMGHKRHLAPAISGRFSFCARHVVANLPVDKAAIEPDYGASDSIRVGSWRSRAHAHKRESRSDGRVYATT